ncbi:RsiW-degrading membrane proteinase PrsW (M82 family) [Glaciihabitans tibetensis]|uniref:RsiW-degrading membrane proteinase PrsW (M82 family) n=2 Tax=Glaciihabitans tibetensis TaxID=1266600 RepID=A0A2T0VHI8_9MICO|nr:RsiW-degrading membrane proteinase PrsW (M82 family) [Glaciihabitans tibetensis]
MPEPTTEPTAAPRAPSEVRAGVVPQPALAGSPKRRYGLVILGVLAIAVLAIIVLLVIVYFIAGLGVSAFIFAGVLAIVPLAIVLLGIRWIDRWDPEPRGALAFCFLWGAGVAVLIALLVGAQVDNVVNSLGGPGPGYEFFGAVIQAPIVEEVGKGLGVLMLFLFARKHFDGPVDGLVYAATVAAGFAFSENILYFGQAIIESGGSVAGVFQIFLIRGLMSPFAHVMFTACIGIFLGLAASRTGGGGGAGFFLIGLIPAVALHALWNGSLFIVRDFYGYYLVIQLPLFLLAIAIVIYLRRQESRVTQRHLTAYALAGWFNPDEVGALATGQGRRTAMRWARQHGVDRAMKRYIRAATRLAFSRQSMVSGHRVVRAQEEEAAQLEVVVASRRALRGE